jgi:hypothetical protein
MPKWTQTEDEYNRVEKIILDTRPSQYVKITLKDRSELLGWLVSSSWGTDAVINQTRGLGPVVKSMWGEMRLLTESGSQTINIDATEVEKIQQGTLRLQNPSESS